MSGLDEHVARPAVFIDGATEWHTYETRPPAQVGVVFVSRDPNQSEGAEATRVTVKCHGPNAEPDDPVLAVWLKKLLSSRTHAQDIWIAEWIIGDRNEAVEFESELASQATLVRRSVATGDPEKVGAILATRPARSAGELLEWGLRWFPGMESAPPSLAKVVVHSSGGVIAAYAGVFPHGTLTAQPSEWFRRRLATRPGAPFRRDSTGQLFEGFYLDESHIESLLAALKALPPAAVERFSATWELGEPPAATPDRHGVNT
jgi:hypothetical protein